MPVKAITFDLDDTLWPIAPVIARAEARLQQWLERCFPEVAERYGRQDLRELREWLASEHPQTAYDYSAMRRLALQRVMQPLGCSAADIEEAFQVFFAARNQVRLYPEVSAALRQLSDRYRLGSISNGNADLEAIGLGGCFEVCVHARDVGLLKPAPEIFAHALERLGLAPHEVVHVGDDRDLDVGGARAAGMHAVWIDRSGEAVKAAGEAVIHSLDELSQLLAEL